MTCPICSAVPAETFRAKYVIAEKCSDCGHIYAKNPAPNQGVQSHPDPDAVLEQYAKRNKRLIKFWQGSGFLQDKSVLLDFGAGSGHILRSLRQYAPNVQIDCIEANEAASEFLRSNDFTVFNSLAQTPVGGYDAILLIEVLEHVNDPVSILTAVKSCLRVGGKIFITTPCGETRTGTRPRVSYDTPEHVQFWTEKSFELCCTRAGVEFRSVNPVIMYPRKNVFERVAYDFLQTARDQMQGIRHIVGFLTNACS